MPSFSPSLSLAHKNGIKMKDNNETLGLAKKLIAVTISIFLGIVVSVVFVLKLLEVDTTKVKHAKLSNDFLFKDIPIIDIRNEQDLKRTAVLKHSILLTFYRKDRRFDERQFLRYLNTIIDKNSKFAILSQNGDESIKVSKLLKSKGYERVINLDGGILEGIKNYVKFVKYDPFQLNKPVL